MQTEHYISTTRVVAVTLWILVGAATLAAWWILFLFEGQSARMASLLLAATASTLACAAAVAHIKLYALKTTALIRLSAGLGQQMPSGPSEGSGLRRVT